MLEIVVGFGLTVVFGAGWASIWFKLGRLENAVNGHGRTIKVIQEHCPVCKMLDGEK